MSRRLQWQYEATPDEDPVINHPIMQAQRNHAQLGQISALFPGANHTRFHHSGYTGHICDRIFDVLAKKGRQPGPRTDLVIGGKLHDGGHPPISHAMEYLLRTYAHMDHNQRIVTLIQSDIRDPAGRTMRDAICESGGDPDNVVRLLTPNNKSPESQIWNHKVVGADVLAYTLMDAEMVGFDQEPPDWERLVQHLTYYEKGLAIDVRQGIRKPQNPISIVCASQQFYFRMYNEVYICPQSIAYERHIQKAAQLAIEARALDPHKVWDMADQTLIDTLENGHHAPNQEAMAKARSAIRGFIDRQPSVPLSVFRYARFAKAGESKIDEPFAIDFANTYVDPTKLTILENKLSQQFGLPILVTVLPDPAKVRPRDLTLADHNRVVGSLRTECPYHFQALEEQADRCFYINVLGPESELARMRRPPQQEAISKALIEYAQPEIDAYRARKNADRQPEPAKPAVA